MRIKAATIGAFCAIILAGCGQSVGEQALFGGAAGAVTGAVVGGDPLVGAVVGAGGNVAFCQLYPAECR
ncbi:hypothetical protein HUK65_09730 [Rhodobacteraceae bacterium 2376]|uniref:Uncharacterized protein n=1 Tax=Rhabdonatronobacter sediminivivens TaxID=2743469 RepID=A0A7Z0HZQ0_9RHOB|nr:hypothetical protein [Rhabdonatronobacter sediminivivens]NYS25271.1 hypothetical protein [Rhabdonatronobacter sediminivivens]